MIAGIDFSTKAVDVVLLDEDTDAATWHHAPMDGWDAFERTRDVRRAMLEIGSGIWDDVLACGIEEPAGRMTGRLFRVQGAILACLPSSLLVHKLMPSEWRRTVGLPGNASKADVELFADRKRYPVWPHPMVNTLPPWPSDPCDAYCIALATRTLLQRTEAA